MSSSVTPTHGDNAKQGSPSAGEPGPVDLFLALLVTVLILALLFGIAGVFNESVEALRLPEWLRGGAAAAFASFIGAGGIALVASGKLGGSQSATWHLAWGAGLVPPLLIGGFLVSKAVNPPQPPPPPPPPTLPELRLRYPSPPAVLHRGDTLVRLGAPSVSVLTLDAGPGRSFLLPDTVRPPIIRRWASRRDGNGRVEVFRSPGPAPLGGLDTVRIRYELVQLPEEDWSETGLVGPGVDGIYVFRLPQQVDSFFVIVNEGLSLRPPDLASSQGLEVFRNEVAAGERIVEIRRVPEGQGE